MNFKKTWKRFFSLSRRNDGFTLVELIVVIAILAILAGVAVPAYNGYIEKANESHDIQLLADINTAFAAACMNNGEDPYKLAGTPEAKLTEKKFDGTITYSEDQGIEDSFELFYDLGEVEFKVYDKLFYVQSVGGFKYDGPITITYKGNTITVSQSEVQDVIDSTFGAMGAPILLGQVGYVTDIVAGLYGAGNDAITGIVTDDYIDDLLASVNLTEEQLAELENDEQKYNQFIANSLVLNVAKNAQNIDSNAILSGLSDGTLATNLYKNVTSSDPTTAQAGLAQTALAYGMYTSYMYNTTGQTTNIANMSTLQTALADPDFQTYMTTAKAQEDMAAYMQALNIVNKSAGSTDAATSVLLNGFTDPELVSQLQSVIG